MSELDFESRLGGQLRTYAQGGVRPIDRFAIAESTVASGSGRRRALQFGRPRPWTTRSSRRMALVLVAAATLLAVAAGALLLSAGHPPAPTPSPTAPPSESHAFVITQVAGPCRTPDGGTTKLPGIVVVDLATLSTRRVADCEMDLLLSPDGRHAVGDAGGHLELIDVQTSHREAIAGGDGRDPEPIAWSPRGTYLQWLTDAEDAQMSVFVGRLNDIRRGRPPRPTDGGYFCCPMWSADESRAVFQSSDGHGRVIGSGDGTDLRALTAIGAKMFAISPDGARIAVALERTDPAGNTLVVNVAVGDGFSPPLDVTHFPDGMRAMAAGWSADGSVLAVVSARGIASARLAAPTGYDLWLIARDGTQRHFTLPPGDDTSLWASSMAWAGDGAHMLIGRHTIRYSQDPPERHFYSFVVISAADGTLASGDGWRPGDAGRVSFSPDGSRYVDLTYPAQVVSLDGTGNISLSDLLDPEDTDAHLVWIP